MRTANEKSPARVLVGSARVTIASPAGSKRQFRDRALLQRCGDHPCAATGCGDHAEEIAGQHPSNPSPATLVHQALAIPGHALDQTSRTFMESRFGHDFSKVRIHTGVASERSARAVSALAYTMSKDIVFAPGRYAPDTSAGKRLLAHELAHVVQQQSLSVSQGQAASGLTLCYPSDRLERNADAAAERVARGAHAGDDLDIPASAFHWTVLQPGTLQRQAGPDADQPRADTSRPRTAAASPVCQVPASWASYTKRPGKSGSGPIVAWTVPRLIFDSGKRAFNASFDASQSWVDPNRVAVGRSRIKLVSDSVEHCKSSFIKGETSYKADPVGECDAAKIGSYTASSKTECNTRVGAELDRDYIADAARVLVHEQYHIRLACAYASAATAALPAKASNDAIRAAFTKFQSDLKDAIEAYDADTDHGCDSPVQVMWQKQIDSGQI